MKDKIRDYITSNIKKGRINNDELHDELIANSFDRYDEYIESGLSSDEAYHKTISLIGEFEENSNEGR